MATSTGNSETGALAQTPLYGWHAEHHGRLVDFAGWSMPVQYSSIVEEHHATRRAVGVFDVSHMGRLSFTGPEATTFLDGLVTRRVADLKPGRIRYSLVCREDGGILDDVLVYRLPGEGEPHLQMVVNASNREKIVAWLTGHAAGRDVAIEDQTTATAMIAVQGPEALGVMQHLVDVELVGESDYTRLAAMKYYTCRQATIAGRDGLVSRTGYTGEDGCEVVVSADDALDVWRQIMAAAEPVGGLPAGLGCRDTLRLEAAMPLYGHELSESINPVQAGLGFAYNLPDREFIGRAAIAAATDNPSLPRRVGLALDGRRVPREGYSILVDDRPVGVVTSGTFSPTFERPIAMGYVEPEFSEIETELTIDLRGRKLSASVIPLPFYQRA
jgi:aminomethyltransferase